MAGCDPIIVGGQSVNIWAEYYSDRDRELFDIGPFTSDDVDFFRNREAARQLAARLDNGTILLPTASDFGTPNSAVVLGELNGRHIAVDFMASVLGVDDESIMDNFVMIEGSFGASTIKLLVMHPLDCVRSRLTNINVLHRYDRHSIVQGIASVRILENYLEDLLGENNFRAAQRILKDLQFVVRDQHIGRPSHERFGEDLDLLPLMDRFCDHPGLDSRWREHVLKRSIGRLRRKAGEEVASSDPTSGSCNPPSG